MVAPALASESVTLCAEVYVPAAGENVGGAAATGRLMVYAAEATLLFVSPASTAMALTVVVLVTGIAALYFVEAVVGADPSSV
jgi:hypothetical protein